MKASEFEKYYCAGQPVEINEALAAKLKPCCDYTSLFYMDKQSLREKYPAVPNISRDAASEDIEIFFDILKYAYAGYDYYSDKVDFEKLKADIIAKIPAVGISTDGLKEIIFEALYPHINDTHFAFIGEKNLNMKHCFTAYFSDLLLEKHGGRVKVISGCATLCGKESDLAEISENLFPTLPSHDGCERFLFGIYSEKPVDALTLGGEERYGKVTPAGILYMPATVPVISADNTMTDDKIKSKLSSELKMNGLLLNDITVIRGMDRTEKAAYIPVKIKADMPDSKTSLASLDEFGKIFNKLDLIVAQMGEDLYSGDIEASPIKDRKTVNSHDACIYCPYDSVCAYHMSEPRMLYEFDNKAVFEQLDKEINGEEEANGKTVD